MLVPFAMGPAAECAEALRGLPLPQLRRLLKRLQPESADAGDPHSLNTPDERALARAWGLDAPDGLAPLAALQVLQSGAGDPAAGWAWITPAQWHVGQDHIAMAHPAQLQLEEADSRALLAAMRPYFEEDGIALTYASPLRWLASGEVFRNLPTASLDRVVGRRIDTWFPSGDAGRGIRRLQQEMQMLLYTHPLTDARQQAGLPPVNSFWVSGTGALPPGIAVKPATALQVAPGLREAALQADWRAWAEAWRQLDGRELAQLLQELDHGRDVRLTLCGESGSRTWSSTAPATAWRKIASMFAAPSPASALEGL